LCVSYRVKRDAMLAALEDCFDAEDGVRWREPGGGLYVWLELPEGLDCGPQGPLFDAAVAEGVLYVPGEYFYADQGQPRCKNTIRLSFGVQDPEGIRKGISALARAVRGVSAKLC
jgi:2-aminoadipate transaminase